MQSFDDLHIFAERLKLVRKCRDLTLHDLALAVGFRDRRNLHPYECGKAAPTITLVRKLAAVLGVDPAYLAGWDLLLP